MEIRNSKKLFFVLTAFIVVLIAGCVPILSAEVNVEIGMGEKWDFRVQVVPAAGYENEVYNRFNEIANNPDNQVNGVKAKVKMLSPLPDGSVPVELEISGSGYETLNQAMGENFVTVDESTAPRTLYIQSGMGIQYMLSNLTFTVSGGKVMEHNGFLENSKTVTWRNPQGVMSATMKEPSFMDYGWMIALVCVGAIGVLVLLVTVLATRRMRRKMPQRSPQRGVRPLVTAKKCVQCGSVIPIQADFCPNCGSRQN